MTTETIVVKGMTCDGCVKSVTNALQRVPGVEAAEVDLAGERATVQFDDSKTNAAALREAVEDAGYDTN